MGTTLTGTTPANTYDSLIKVTDNGPLSGTAKYLSDGLGNDSVLALSTSQALLNGNLLFNSGYAIGANTSDGSDNQGLYLCGGANQTVGRGANIRVHGNEFSGNEGDIVMYSGNVANSEIQLRAYTSSSIISFYTNETEKMRISPAGNVGIGTSNPNYSLQVNSSTTTTRLQITNSTTGTSAANGLQFIQDGNNTTISLKPSGFMSFETTNAERLRIDSSGNVGIGTDSPLAKLQTTTAGTAANEVGLRLNNPNGNVAPTGVDIVFQSGYTTGNSGAAVIRGGRNSAATDSYITFLTNSGSGLAEVGRWLPTGGLTFNGDTAAANALDDYEEGTFTATAVPSTSGTITLSVNSCTYTKIGRQVTIKGQLVVGSVASPVGTLVTIGGLPFTTINSVAGRGAGSATYFPAVGSGSLPLNYQLQNAVEWNLVLTASTIAAGDEFYITLTYFV